MIGAEKQPGPLPHTLRQSLEKSRLQQAVLVVPLLRPRIREQHPDFLEHCCGWQGMQEFARFAAQEATIFKVVANAFFFGALDPLLAAINADKTFIPAKSGIMREEMAVAAADFPDQSPGSRRKERACLRGQIRAPGGDVREERRGQNCF
jgi:hypothetical protein